MTREHDRASRILHRLRSRPGGETGDWAFVGSGNQIWASQAPSPKLGHARTAISDLVHGVHELLGDQTFFVLRNRIWCSGESTPYCRGAVKVAAKRLTSRLELSPAANNSEAFSVQVVPAFAAAPFAARALWPEPDLPSSAREYFQLVARMAEQVERGSVLHRYDRALAAIIVAEDGAIIAGATNAGSTNKSMHAEVIAVRSLNGPIPRGSTVYCTMKPCRMCAGAIWQASQNPQSTRLVYAHNDQGPMAQGTVFDPGAYELSLALAYVNKNA